MYLPAALAGLLSCLGDGLAKALVYQRLWYMAWVCRHQKGCWAPKKKNALANGVSSLGHFPFVAEYVTEALETIHLSPGILFNYEPSENGTSLFGRNSEMVLPWCVHLTCWQEGSSPLLLAVKPESSIFACLSSPTLQVPPHISRSLLSLVLSA